MYEFISPLDHVPMRFESLEEAITKAREYIGHENAWDEEITQVVVYKVIKVATVTADGIAIPKGE